MKTKDQLVSIIERVVQSLGNTVRNGGKFLSNDRVDAFWETIRNECELRMVLPSALDANIFFIILFAYTRAKKRKGYDCACELASSIFKAYDGSVVASLFKAPFEAYFKQTQHKNPFLLNGYFIRHTQIRDFATALADIGISSGANTGFASDLEGQIFTLLMLHKGKQNDQDLAKAVVRDLKNRFQMGP